LARKDLFWHNYAEKKQYLCTAIVKKASIIFLNAVIWHFVAVFLQSNLKKLPGQGNIIYQ